MNIKNDRLLRALLRQEVDCTPIWLMRQAGRYLPEYRQIRAEVKDFMELCKNPQLACEVTMQPLRRFDLDAAILFSDILTIPDAMGLGLYFAEGEGPKFKKPITTETEIKNLRIPDPEQELSYVCDAVRAIKKALAGEVPLIGFSGSPWTLACYMIEGQGSKQFNVIKAMAYDQPQLLHQLLDKLAIAVTDYLNAQIAAGVQAVMIFDTWGGLLSTAQFTEFSYYYLEKIFQGLTRTIEGQVVPRIVFVKQGNLWLEKIAQCGCDAVGLDWTIDMGAARTRIGDKVALQGNLDPSALYAEIPAIQQEAYRILESFGPGPGHVFNLGHGIHPTIKPDKVAALVDAVHRYKKVE